MLGSLLKVVAVIIVGYIVGYFLGSILGAMVGLVVGFFIPDFILPHQATLISLFVAITLGCFLGSFALQVLNRLYDASINSILGLIAGVIVGLIVVVFVYGYIEISDFRPIIVQRFVITPAMDYSVKIGSQIGAITFALFGAVGFIRETIRSHFELQRNRELMKNSPLSNWGLPEMPREVPPIQAKLTTRSFLPLQSRIDFQKGGRTLFLLKTFVSAFAIGMILSMTGWKIFGWNSGAQFSEGLFWTSALLAMYGYIGFRGAYKGIRNIGETAGDMNLHERTSHWATEAETIFERLPNTFLIGVWLFVFAILISIVF